MLSFSKRKALKDIRYSILEGLTNLNVITIRFVTMIKYKLAGLGMDGFMLLSGLEPTF